LTERFQQTLKKWLRAQPDQPTTIAELQALLDTFREEYNHRRPHRSLEHRSTPATAYTARPKATPGSDPATDTHDRIRKDKINKAGTVTLRVAGRLTRRTSWPRQGDRDDHVAGLSRLRSGGAAGRADEGRRQAP
jgi:hypothetical protein